MLIPLQILYPTSVSWKKTSLYVCSSNNTYFTQKEPIKVKISETFECSGQNLSNSLCQFWNDKSIPLQILYFSSVSWKITPLYFFSSNNIYILCSKGAHYSENFWDFRVSRSKFVKFLMSNLKRQVHFVPNFVSLFSFMKDYFFVLF